MKRLFYAFIVIVILWGAGFLAFALSLTGNTDITTLSHEQRDAVIVLTGGEGRIDRGLSLLMRGQAKQALISGVHPSVRLSELLPQGTSADMTADLTSRIELDTAPENTIDNARLSAVWVSAKGIQTIYLVTSDYHMPRALLLFKRESPDLDIMPITVDGHVTPTSLAIEYSKYLFMQGQMLLVQSIS